MNMYFTLVRSRWSCLRTEFGIWVEQSDSYIYKQTLKHIRQDGSRDDKVKNTSREIRCAKEVFFTNLYADKCTLKTLIKLKIALDL